MKVKELVRVDFWNHDYIEKNKSGYIYVGTTANNFGHIIRKYNLQLEQLKENEDFNKLVSSYCYQSQNV